jgi:hypothetical protein
LHHGGTEPRREKINGFFSDRRGFVPCTQGFDISALCRHWAGEDTESGQYCRSPVKFGFFRGLIFPIRAQFRNIDILLLMEPQGSGGPKRNPFIFCCSPCLRASVVQRFCLWLRQRRAAFQGSDLICFSTQVCVFRSRRAGLPVRLRGSSVRSGRGPGSSSWRRAAAIPWSRR